MTSVDTALFGNKTFESLDKLLLDSRWLLNQIMGFHIRELKTVTDRNTHGESWVKTDVDWNDACISQKDY